MHTILDDQVMARAQPNWGARGCISITLLGRRRSEYHKGKRTESSLTGMSRTTTRSLS